MNKEVETIHDIIDDIKTNITDNQYKIIMDCLLKINNNYHSNAKERELNMIKNQLECLEYLEQINDENNINVIQTAYKFFIKQLK